ncbi:MAG: DUF4403 family protein [Pseudomonadota bacterium]|uniref:DUF4403 family protein n=1 Tax=Sphingobium naphthae TaxID=1886786 RepID=UPI002B16DEEA|nr:DUF4403 family protein [Pseudomonadota bacterium]
MPDALETSIIAVPIEASSDAIRQAIERSVPRILWTINQREPRCIAPQKLRILGEDIKVTPPISCTIVGTVTRGPVTLHGEGQTIIADVPVHARISARDVAGVLKGETATGSAHVQARIRLDIDRQWKPTGKIDLHYDWTTPPGIDFLGQRIRFTDQADEKLRPVVAQLERDLPRELAKLNLRSRIEALWRDAFTTLELNRRNPPVWMRVAPSRVFYNGYSMRGRTLRLDLGLEATTQTFVGDRPPPPQPKPLPPLDRSNKTKGLRFRLPVTADYQTLVPVIQKALDKRAARPFHLPALGDVRARFSNITCYGSVGGRIAVSVDISARRDGAARDTHGRVWLAARPVNAANSPEVSFVDPIITGDTDGIGGDTALAISRTRGFADLIATALSQNFAKDIAELKVTIARAIANKRVGDFVIKARANDFEIGQLHAYGEGLHLPVRATGEAQILYQPR